jgi:hypothetical protein
MGLLSNLFGNKEQPTRRSVDDHTIASWIASTIDGVVQTQGFSTLFKQNAAIVLDKNYKVSMTWSPSLKENPDILSFVYLTELSEFESYKSTFDFSLLKDLPPNEAKEIADMMVGALGDRATDMLAIAALHAIKAKIKI